jgi:hypothetical protein
MINRTTIWRESALAIGARRARVALVRRLPIAAWWRLVARLWWPFEAGNDLRPLYARNSNRAFPAYVPDRTGTDLAVLIMSVRRRIVIQRRLVLLARTLWLALTVALVLMLGRFVTEVSWLAIGAAMAAVALLGLVYDRTHPVTIWTAARLLDRHLGLREQVTTAIELVITPAPVRLASAQVMRALAVMREVRQGHRFRPRVPWAEVQMIGAIGLLVLGLSLAAGSAERLATPRSILAPNELTTVDLADLGLTEAELAAQLASDPAMAGMDEYGMYPGYNETVDLTGVDVEALRQAAELSNRSAKELEEIANALKDASITSQAAQSIQQGDYQRASEQIGELAKAIEGLSPEARADLAERLKQAAQNVQPMDPELARRLDQAAKAVASRSDRAAAQGLEDLSKAIAETGNNVIPQAQLAEALTEMGEGASINSEQGPESGQSAAMAEAGQAALGEGEAGEFNFGLAEGAIGSLPINAGISDDGSGGSGAGQGSGSQAEVYQPRLDPNATRVDVQTDQGTGPTAPRLGRNQAGAPDVITTGPGTTGPGNVPQGNQPIKIGLDANRVPRGLRSVVEGYFRAQPK